MPLRPTNFREEWLLLDDKNGTNISEWCTKGKDDSSAYCFLCKSTISITNSGKTQLMQHASTVKHNFLDAARKDKSQSRLVSSAGSKAVHLDTGSTMKKTQVPWTLNEGDELCKSEILWVIHAALNNYSFLSCDSVKELFPRMFPDSALSKGIQLSSRKVSYVISHGLGPYFLKQITDEFKKETPFFTLMYDETLNEQHVKQLDIHVRYWSLKSNCISERFIGCELMGHATALDISAGIKTIIGACAIDLKGLLMLGSDGPNVNKSVFKLIDAEVKSLREFGLINVGTCNLHVIHNSFGNGLKMESFTNIIDFLENIHHWFAKFPSRQQDLKKAMDNFGEEHSKILRYVSNRWLTVVKVCQRTLQILPSLKVYFIEDLPKEKSTLLKSNRYHIILKMLESPLTPVYLHFIISVGSLFEHFLKLLQDKSTLIHILHDELSKLLLKLMKRFVKDLALKEEHGDVYKEKRGEQLLDIDVRKEALCIKKIDVGCSARKILLSLSPELKGEFLMDAKQFYIAVTTYLQERLPLKNKLLQNIQILHPLMRNEPVECSLPSLRRLATMLPIVIPEDCIDKLTDEWRLYVSDIDICTEWSSDSESSKPIDYFWNQVFNMTDLSTRSQRYPYLTVLVKAVLTFSHGQASVERGFSINKRMLTAERSSMNIDTIRGLRMIKDGVQGKASDVCITQEMIQFYKDAYSKYKTHKANEKETKKRNQVNAAPPEKKISCDKLAGLKDNISSAQSMLNEGTKRLETGLKRKCLKEIEAAQALIDAGNKRLKLANDIIIKKD